MAGRNGLAACVAGHVCLDIIPEIPDKGTTDLVSLLVPGKLLNIGRAAFGTGGAVANTGVTLRKLGVDTLFMSRIGDDYFGRIIADLLGRHGDVSGLRVSGRPDTSYSLILAFPGVDRIFLHDPGSNDMLTSEDLDYDRIGALPLFHFGYPPLMRNIYLDDGEELLRIFSEVRRRGTTTSLDASLPDPDSESGRVDWKRVFRRVLPDVDLFTPSVDEALFFLEPSAYLKRRAAEKDLVPGLEFGECRRVAAAFLDMGCGAVLLKAGAKGVYFRSGRAFRGLRAPAAGAAERGAWASRELWAPAFVIDRIASATGAGDACIGGFLAALLRGLDAEQSLRVAACLGYQNLTAMDATGGIRTWPETLDLLDRLTIRPLDWNARDAVWDDGRKIWRGRLDEENP
jgi:sugar/nucleoside kinase (ribokinase family)